MKAQAKKSKSAMGSDEEMKERKKERRTDRDRVAEACAMDGGPQQRRRRV